MNCAPGFKEETLSIGRYAELLTTSRGFTADEQQQFESFGQQAYRSFVTKVSHIATAVVVVTAVAVVIV